MGTDIHMTFEARRDGKWTNMDKFKVDEDGYMSNYDNRLYSDRNYDLFAILANVRNGHGFAGVDTGDGFIPISEPRGAPDDMDETTSKWLEGGAGDHSGSWLTVAEMLAYDWTQKTVKRGIVGSLSELARWKNSGAPDGWSGSISGPGIGIIQMNDSVLCRIERLMKTIGKDRDSGREFNWWSLYHSGDNEWGNKGTANVSPQIDLFRKLLANEFGYDRPHFSLEWGRHYYECASTFLSEVMPKLWRLGAPKDVRIIFNFDS